MTSGAHAAIPVPLCLVESCSMLSAVVKILLVSDLVAHVAVIGRAYQGLRVDIRNWLPVPSPPPLSLFPAPLQHWAPSHAMSQLAGYEAAGLLAQPPAAAPAPGSQGRQDAADPRCCLGRVSFQRCVAMRKVATYLWSQTAGKSFSSSLKESTWGFWSGKGQKRCQRGCLLLS